MPPPRSTKVEYERRLLAVQAWLIEGNTHALVMKNILDQGWAQSKRHAEKMIQQARERWIDYEEENIEKKRRFKIQELKHKIKTMDAAAKKTPAGLQVILNYEKEIIKLEGLSTSKVIQLEGNPDKPLPIKHIQSDVDYSQLSDEVLLQIVAARKPSQEEV